MAIVKVKDVVTKYVPKCVSTSNASRDVEEAIKKVFQSIHELRKVEKSLNEAQSEVDQALAMVLHGSELDNLEITPANSYRIVKFMRECQLERRKIKEASGVYDSAMSKIGPQIRSLLAKENPVRQGLKAKIGYREQHNRITVSPVFSDLKVLSEEVNSNERYGL